MVGLGIFSGILARRMGVFVDAVFQILLGDFIEIIHRNPFTEGELFHQDRIRHRFTIGRHRDVGSWVLVLLGDTAFVDLSSLFELHKVFGFVPVRRGGTFVSAKVGLRTLQGFGGDKAVSSTAWLTTRDGFDDDSLYRFDWDARVGLGASASASLHIAKSSGPVPVKRRGATVSTIVGFPMLDGFGDEAPVTSAGSAPASLAFTISTGLGPCRRGGAA